MSAVRTALDSAATRDVVSADDLEACLSDVMGAPVAVDTAGGEVKVSRLASKACCGIRLVGSNSPKRHQISGVLFFKSCTCPRAGFAAIGVLERK